MKAQAGFSLVEVTLALGVMAFALVGIMAMFPIAMQAGRESQQETRATFIAQAIFSELSAGTNATNRVLLTRIEPAGNRLTTNVNLANPASFAIMFDADGIPAGQRSVAEFSNSLSSPEWVYATKVSISTNGLIAGLSRIEVEVTAPAAAPLTNRSRYPYITLLRNQ
jgi:uncharacterized protein (TIGR02598 family)